MKQYEENNWFGEPYYEEEKFHDTFWDEDPYYNQTQNEEFEVNYSQYEAPYQEPKRTYGKAIEDFEIDYEKEVASSFRDDYYEKQWTDDVTNQTKSIRNFFKIPQMRCFKSHRDH